MGSIAPAGMRSVAAAVSKNAERYSFTGPHVESLRSSNACWATTPATWCWPWPSRGVPVKIVAVMRPEPPHHRDDVGEHGVAGPEAERLSGGLGEAEVVRARKKLMRTVQLARGEELLGADHAQLGAELGADEVLAALAAAQGEIGGLGAEALGEIGEELSVFVIGVGADDEDAFVRPELLEQVRQRRDAAGARGGEGRAPPL